MKDYDNFDNTFLTKLLCIIAVLALAFVIAVVAIGLLSGESLPNANDSNAETFVFDESNENSTNEAEETEYSPESIRDTEPVPPETVDTETEAATSEPLPDITDEPAPTMLGETEDMGQEYIDSVIFLGDSATYGLKSYQMLKDGRDTKQLWATKNATLTLNDILSKKIVYPESGEEVSIASAAEMSKPEILIITLGIEGIVYIEEDDFKEEYSSLIDAVLTASPHTKIILQSIFPVASEIKNSPKLTNELVDRANTWVYEIASGKGLRYLDTQSVLKNESGVLDSKFDNGGTGITLNDTGFSAVLDYIRTHGYK